MRIDSAKPGGDDFDLDAMMDDAKSEIKQQVEEKKIDITGYTAQQLDELVHKLTATRLVEALQVPELCTPGLLQAAMRFLSDNKVTGLDIPGSAGEDIREAYKAKAPFKLTG